jgi:hypothetical protein
MIAQIEEAPFRLRKAVDGLSDEQLDTPYREGGWTVRQVAHHVADSHLNAYIRVRLALTEDNPTIRPYRQEKWAELLDARTGPVEVSLVLLESVHSRWVMLLRSMQPGQFATKLHHPEEGEIDLNWILQMYGWHGRHHVAHVTELRKRKGW